MVCFFENGDEGRRNPEQAEIKKLSRPSRVRNAMEDLEESEVFSLRHLSVSFCHSERSRRVDKRPADLELYLTGKADIGEACPTAPDDSVSAPSLKIKSGGRQNVG